MVGQVLIVDCDAEAGGFVADSLEREGFGTTIVGAGEDALAALEQERYDAVVLEIGLPRLSGIEVCRRLRRRGDVVPIVFASAQGAEVDRVLGLEVGADDYIVKPFSPIELVSRVRAILRRREYEQDATGRAVVEIGGLRIDFACHMLEVEGRPVGLTPSEFKVLALLAERRGQVLSRTQIMERLWESQFVGDEHACEVHISNLRAKIERDRRYPERLVTVRGFGYKLVEA